MHPLVEQYIDKVKTEVLESLGLCEKEYYPTEFKATVNREQFPSHDYTPNRLKMITAHKYLEGFDGSAEEYGRISDEFWYEELTEDGEDYILFRRYKTNPISISDEEFWELIRYAKIDPNGPINTANVILEKMDFVIEAIENIELYSND